MLNAGVLWLALSICSEITGTSFIKKTNNFRKPGMSVLVICAYSLCYFALTKAMGYIPVDCIFTMVWFRYYRCYTDFYDPL